MASYQDIVDAALDAIKDDIAKTVKSKSYSVGGNRVERQSVLELVRALKELQADDDAANVSFFSVAQVVRAR